MKFDLSDPNCVDQIIDKFADKRLSNLKVDFDEKSGSGNGNNRVSGVSSCNYDDWDCISESEVMMEGMDDPFKDKWNNICKKYKEISPYGSYKTYRLAPMIVKANDDLR